MLEQLLKQPLPVELKVFHAGGGSLLRFENDSGEWCFPSPRRLLEKVQVGRTSIPYVRQLECFAALIQTRVDVHSIPIEGGGDMSLLRLRQVWAIADSGGDILFLDPDSNFSVWVFYHDAPSVARNASNFYEWLMSATPHAPAPPTQHVPRDVLRICIEDALRDYIRHVLVPRALVNPGEFLTTIAGHTVLNRDEGKIVDKLADLIVSIHELDPQRDRQRRDALFDEIARLASAGGPSPS